MYACTGRECAIELVPWGLFVNCIQPAATPPGGIFIGYLSTFPKPVFFFFCFDCHQFPSIAIIFSSTICSPTDANVFGIAKYLVFADQPAPIPPIQTITSRRTNLLPMSRRIDGSNILSRPRKTAAMEQQLMIGETDVQNSPLPSDTHAAWARYHRLNITSNILEIHTATWEQLPSEQRCRLNIERVRLVNNRRVRSVFVANQQRLFQVPASVSCDSFSVPSFEAHYLTF